MRICAISDLHGQYNFECPEAEILCIAGDIVPGWAQFDTESSLIWFEEEFIPWCEKQPAKKVFFIAGNHDWFLYKLAPDVIKNLTSKFSEKVTYLIDETVEYTSEEDGQTYKIYGTPWCHQFYDWAFMTSDEELEKIFEKIPEDTDILISHDAPYGRTDLLLQNKRFMDRGHIGNIPMTHRLEKISPKLHFTGHLHSCNHVPEDYNGTTTVCVSMIDEDYRMNYKPFLITI